jgi:hypothetical protein
MGADQLEELKTEGTFARISSAARMKISDKHSGLTIAISP